jgi:hypothetical protein
VSGEINIKTESYNITGIDRPLGLPEYVGNWHMKIVKWFALRIGPQHIYISMLNLIYLFKTDTQLNYTQDAYLPHTEQDPFPL